MGITLEELQNLTTEFDAATKGNHPKFGSSPVDPKLSNELIRTLDLLANDPAANQATKENLSSLRGEIAGYQLSFWLPRGAGRKTLMLLAVIVAVVSAVIWNQLWLLMFILAATFSPRIVGEGARLLGRLSGQWQQTKNA
jgi:hypothetical protein